jgi:hypothetical protein
MGSEGVLAAVGQMEIPQGPAVSIAWVLGRVGDEDDLLAEQGGGGELGGFWAPALHGLAGVSGLGSVDPRMRTLLEPWASVTCTVSPSTT